MQVQTLVTEAAVERLDEGIIRRLSRPGKCQRYFPAISPQVGELARKFAAIVAVYSTGCAPLTHDLVQNRHHFRAGHSKPWHRRQRFSGMNIHHGQYTKLRAIVELIRHEVHSPGFVRPLCHTIIARSTLPADMSPRPFLPQLQTLQAIKAMHTLVINLNTFAPQQDVNALVPISHPARCQLLYPQSQAVLRRPAVLIAVSCPRQIDQPAGSSFTDFIARSQMAHRVPALRCAYHFRELISCSIALSRLRSATSFLRRSFSSRSCFSSRTWLGSSPP